MNLHNQIMNIECEVRSNVNIAGTDAYLGYKEGHRDARHAAAELALESDRRIDMLAEALVDLMGGMRNHDIAAHTGYGPRDCERLAEVKAWAVEHQRHRAAVVDA